MTRTVTELKQTAVKTGDTDAIKQQWNMTGATRRSCRHNLLLCPRPTLRGSLRSPGDSSFKINLITDSKNCSEIMLFSSDPRTMARHAPPKIRFSKLTWSICVRTTLPEYREAWRYRCHYWCEKLFQTQQVISETGNDHTLRSTRSSKEPVNRSSISLQDISNDILFMLSG